MGSWDWNTIWTGLAAIGTVGTLFLLSAPKISGWFLKEQKRMRLNHFFHDLKNDGWPRHLSELEHLTVLNINDDKHVQGSLLFYKYQNVFLNNNENFKINGISIPHGYHTYHILSDNCIRLDLIDDNSGDRRSAFIFKKNNVCSKTHNNMNIFKKITSWKYE